MCHYRSSILRTLGLVELAIVTDSERGESLGERLGDGICLMELCCLRDAVPYYMGIQY